MISRRAVVVLVAVVRMPNDVGGLSRSKAVCCIEVMVTERKGEV
jgi:hypothetical protein